MLTPPQPPFNTTLALGHEAPVPWYGIVTAGGSSQRFRRGKGSVQSKVLVPLNGVPVLEHACMALLNEGGCRGVVITAPANMLKLFEPIKNVLDQRFPEVSVHVVEGGEHRRASVWKGIQALYKGKAGPAGLDHAYMVVHDGARPLLTPGWLSEALQTLDADTTLQGLIAAAPVSDTLKRVEPDTLTITETCDRSTLWAVQTPQLFRAKALYDSYQAVDPDTPVTDDAQLLELAYGNAARVKVYPCTTNNLKITTPEDVTLATAIMACRVLPSC